MNNWIGKINFTWLKQVLWNLFLISLGSVLCAVAVNGILIPQKFLSAGFTGLALGIHYLVPHLPVPWLYLALNIPLFILGRKYVGPRFFLYSIFGVVIYSLALKWILFIPGIQDKILSALLAGIIMGTGTGVILRSLGSAGGLDILSVIMRQHFSIRLGTTSLAFNGIILTGAAFLISLDGALYTLIYVYVNSYMLNLVVTGLSQRKAVFIISSQWTKISQAIIGDLNRGVTHIRGEGGFTGREEMILYTVITFQELSRLKRIIHQADPKAFLVVTETLEVMGKRIGNQPHW